ncbi:uncharacterized protein EI90DRAFT_3022354 [Cantharellus anzutake]|uniref:uncharacterized protein n=1 Tax=Cantharellus anzutake TaxID=1750568 RepID=UPI001903F0AD|nr:uncharacterized protein EI90DRAFT_3022354 [Cantharellus anzutake]KAF8314393.1 hypothetical protein EI90DRAFT_3022354 [Cantharellus anzutake]
MATVRVFTIPLVTFLHPCRFRLLVQWWFKCIMDTASTDVTLTLAQFGKSRDDIWKGPHCSIDLSKGLALAVCLKSNLTHQIEQTVTPLRPLILSWLLIEAVVDTLIAASMWYFLSRQRTGFRETDSAITILTVYAINMGVVTTILAMTVMFAFAFYGYHLIHMAFVLIRDQISQAMKGKSPATASGVNDAMTAVPPAIEVQNTVTHEIEIVG